MRPHVEIVDENDLVRHPSELVGGEGEALQRNLAYDEQDGSVSARVSFVTDWTRPAGRHAAETEWYVLSGEVKLGTEVLGPGGFWHAPSDVSVPAISARAGTEILYFRDYGDWAFLADDRAPTGDASRLDERITVVRTDDLEWLPVEEGSPMRFDLGGTPVPGLDIKMLHRDDDTGFYTRLIRAKPGWREEPLAHHPVFEEAYCLEGGFDYNFGRMYPGTYFFRPPLIRHGDFTADADAGCTWLVRCDGDLVDWYTEGASLEMKGTPTNWGPDLPHTIAPVLSLPVRSKSLDPMPDPFYQ